MKRVLFGSLLLAALVLPVGTAVGGSAATPSADVEPIAVVVLNVGTTSTTNFNFNVYNCPAGEVINIIPWDAEQVDAGTAATGDALLILSTGDPVQHVVLSAVGNLRPGFMWTGSGVVTCGPVPIPVTGSGQTKSTHGL